MVLVSFGGPEGPDDVEPFLRNVTRGRDVPPARLAQVAEQYARFGGVSPLNGQCRALLSAIRRDFAVHGVALPVYWGNRNWHPYLGETLAQMRAHGITRALAFITSPYSSYSSCRQYLEEFERAAFPVVRLGPFFDHPGFVEPMAGNTARALVGTDPAARAVLFTAHSIPLSMAAGCAYRDQIAHAARLVAARAGVDSYELVWQSRSGPPHVPWLEPDIGAAITAAAGAGARDIVVVPIGFISDHMEVVHDLDLAARAVADGAGARMHRAATVGTDSRFVAMVRELAGAAIDPHAPRPYCTATCCPATIHP